MWLFILLAMAVIAVICGLVTGRIAGGLDDPESSLPFRGLPPADVAPEDLDTVRFSPALRGYRMDQVDQVLDQLTEELRRRDDQIAHLRSLVDQVDAEAFGPAAGSLEPEPADAGPAADAIADADADAIADADA